MTPIPDDAPGEAISLGRGTPALVDAFGNPLVQAARAYEFGPVGVVLVLMLAQPF